MARQLTSRPRRVSKAAPADDRRKPEATIDQRGTLEPKQMEHGNRLRNLPPSGGRWDLRWLCETARLWLRIGAAIPLWPLLDRAGGCRTERATCIYLACEFRG